VGSGRRRRASRRGGGARQQDAPPPRPRAGLKATIDSFGGVLTIGAIVVGIVVVGVLVFLNRPGSGSSVNDAPFVPIERVQADGRIAGDPNAPVRIVSHEDFQCPFCRQFATETAPVIEEEFVETGIASIEYRHLAFLGEESLRAAEASECAADQGLFWEYHDMLFLRQGDENDGVYSTGHLKDFAREVDAALPDRGFDLDAFDACLDSGAKRPLVEAQSEQSRELLQSLTGRASTPTFLVNGQPLPPGAQPIEVFRTAIAAARGSAGSDGS
jgi:protein-disulfide isomerase